MVVSYSSSYRELREAAMKLMGEPANPTYTYKTSTENPFDLSTATLEKTLPSMKIYIDWGDSKSHD